MERLPETQYAWDGAAHVAFQQFGSGNADLVLVHEWMSHQEVRWEQPELARFLRRHGDFARVLTFDKRGCGLSDPVTLGAMPTLEEWADDVITAMDAAGVDRATLMGIGAGGPMTILAAASHPDRVDGLVARQHRRALPARSRLSAWVARGRGAGDPGRRADRGTGRRRLLAGRATRPCWATGGRTTPSCGSGSARYRRLSVSPAAWMATDRLIVETDVRGALPAIRVPDAGPAPARHRLDACRPWALPGRAHSQRAADRAGGGRACPVPR